MCLTPEQEAAIEDYKGRMGMDPRIGQQLSDIARSLTPKVGEALSKEHFNPVVRDVIRRLCPNRSR